MAAAANVWSGSSSLKGLKAFMRAWVFAFALALALLGLVGAACGYAASLIKNFLLDIYNTYW